MNEKRQVVKVWVDEQAVYARLASGEVASYAFSLWKRLANATQEQRQNFTLSYTGIHWPQIDEDLSFEGMFASAGICSRACEEEGVYFDL